MQSEFYHYLRSWILNRGVGIWLGLLIVLAVLSCEPTLKVSSDFDKSVDFKQYKSYWLFEGDSFKTAVSELNRGRIINSIKNEMAKKGFTEDHANPGVLVNTVAIVSKKVSVSANTDYYGYGGYYRPYYWGGGMGGGSSTTSYNVEHYKDGSLIIDIVDASSKKLIWQGIGNSKIDEPLKDPDNQIPKAIQKIMEGFPPKKK
jgi:hypothetical protein